MTLRRAVLIFGGLLLVLAAVLLTRPVLWGVALYLAVYGVFIAGGILFERAHYLPPVDRTDSHWQATDERFVDPTTGQLMAVRYNPATGGRDYVPAEESGNTAGRKRDEEWAKRGPIG